MSANHSVLTILLRITAAVIVVTALLLAPAPLLPPSFLAEKIQFYLGIRWKFAYLASVVGFQAAFFLVVGIISALVVKRSPDWHWRLLQIVIVPLIVVAAMLIIRSIKMGHFPVWMHAAIPIAASIAGVWLGLGLMYRRLMLMLLLIIFVAGVTVWAISGTMTPELSLATKNQLVRLNDAGKNFPKGEAKFGAMLQSVFTPGEGPPPASAVERNRAAILALGIVVGDERLVRFIELENEKELLEEVVRLRKGTTLHKRHDWSRHFCLSAALAVLENPLVSDAGGLLKGQMDAMNGGSGFSFGDFAADRAGVRFAEAATNSEEDALAMQQFLLREYDVNNFLPPVSDLPEKMTQEQFREKYGNTGSKLYRQQVNEIEKRLDSCVALSPLHSGK